jgi:predicted metal-dependent hydrolase
LPDEPFPPYAFVPGRFPHPTADPAGHSYGKTPPSPSQVEPDQWHECRPYLHGIDLFNAGFFWESHVAWESLWLACGRRGAVADFLKGLIHLAAAGVKALERRPEGVKSHSRRAAELWRRVIQSLEGPPEFFMGFRGKDLIALAEKICQEGWPSPPPVLMPTLPD